MATGDARVHELAPHALVVPARGYGHVSASLLLSKALAEVGFDISFVCFASEYASIKAKKSFGRLFQSSQMEMQMQDPSPDSPNHPISSPYGRRSGSAAPAIRVHVLDDSPVSQDLSTFFLATPAMVENFETLLLKLEAWGTPPTCLISDSMAPWTVPVAQRFGLPRVDYYSASAMSYIVLIHSPHLYSQGIFPMKADPTQWNSNPPLMLDPFSGFPPLPAEIFGEIPFADSSSFFPTFFKEISSLAKTGKRILIQTMSELDRDAFRALGLSAETPAYAIGPLHSYIEDHQDKQDEDKATTQDDCLTWLDIQSEGSLVYVAFGSMASLSTGEIEELAHGLEASKVPFLWVVSDGGTGDLSQVLDLDGLLRRARGKGMIISWAPQVKVLEHKAVGGFLSHCGWNSTIDSF